MAQYTTGRGFSPKSNFFVDEQGNIQRGNVHGTLGLRGFWQGRGDFSAGGPIGDWREIKRPPISEGRGPLGRPSPPSPARLGQRIGAAVSGFSLDPEKDTSLSRQQYRNWERSVGSRMDWRGGVERGGERVSGRSLAPAYSTAGQAASQAARDESKQRRSTRVSEVAEAMAASRSTPVATPTSEISRPQGSAPPGTQFAQAGTIPGMSYGGPTGTRTSSGPLIG